MSKSSMDEWEKLFNMATPAERYEITVMMFQTIEARRQAEYDLCKADPKQLESMPVTRLRELADIVTVGARGLILSALAFSGYSELVDVLHALEGLNSFTASKDEPTASEIKDTLAYIQIVWTEEKKIEDSAPITAPQSDKKQKHAGVMPAAHVSTKAKGQKS
jgi:hypothetical protein